MGRFTAAQEAAVGHGRGLLVVAGGPGTGKTTVLRHRWLRLADEAGPGTIVTLCRTRGAADRFQEALLPDLRGGFDALSFTTVWGLAFDAVRRTGRAERLLSGAEQRHLVRQLLDGEARRGGHWPTLDGYVGRAAFAEEVAAVLLDLQSDLADPAAVRSAAAAAGVADRWDELLGFAERYRAVLAERGWVDSAGVLAAAAELDLAGGRFAHALVDDLDGVSPAGAAVVSRLVATVDSAMVTGDPDADLDGRLTAVGTGTATVQLDHPFRASGPGTLVRCHHPAVEADAIAGELLAAQADGLSWDEMAVLVRAPAGRGQAVARALARHGVPATAPPARVGDEPALRGLVDLLAWAQGDDAALDRLLASPVADLDAATVRALRRRARDDGTPLERQPELSRLVAARDELVALGPVGPAELAHAAFRVGLGHLVHNPEHPAAAADDRAVDALVAWLGAIGGAGEPADDPWVATPTLPGRVTVTSIAAAAGREWQLVALAGALEGELPRVRTGRRFFDRPLLGAGPVPTIPERRQRSLDEERLLFAAARSRAVRTFIAFTAPEPGVAVSRFVDGWPERGVSLPPPVAAPAEPLAPTAGVAPVWPEGTLRLSATQLDTYADCPLRYAYRYALGVRDESSVYADLGSLVHEVLQRFLDPGAGEPRTRERLHEIADECWRDDIARYRPQLEEARRDYNDMLDLWWEKEGDLGDLGPKVLGVERGFDIALGPHTVRGRIDRIDRADDDAGIRVVDYKTGKAMPRPDAMADDLQLATYHLAATRDPELAAWGPPTQLRLLFLRRMETREQEVRPDHAEVTEARILATADRILAEDFEPSAHADCDHCDFHRLCPLWPEGREVGEK